MLEHEIYGALTVADLGGKGSMSKPRRQKSPFALLSYSFTVANDANLYPLSIQCASHSIVISIQSINHQLQVLLTVSETCL